MKRMVALCCVTLASLGMIGCADRSTAGATDGCAGASAVTGYDVSPPVDDGWWLVGYDGAGDPTDPAPPPCDPSSGCDDGSSGGGGAAGDTGGADPGAGADNGGDPSTGDGTGSDTSDDGSGDDGSGDDSSDDALRLRAHHGARPRTFGAPMCATCGVVCTLDAPSPGEPQAIAAVGSSSSVAGACADAQRQLAEYARDAFGRRLAACGPDTGQPLTAAPAPPPPGRALAQPTPAAHGGALRPARRAPARRAENFPFGAGESPAPQPRRAE